MSPRTPGTAAAFPKVSVYIVNHNYGQYVERAIESVLGQSFQDYELLIIDNGSTDGSREVIERYARHEKVVTFFQDNIGLNRTNNVAIDRSTGRYVIRLDADDYLHENALEVLAGALDQRPDVGLVFPDYFLVDADGSVLDVVQRHDFDEVTLLDQPAHGACTMIRRECLETLDGYDESYHCQDGWDIWVRFIGRYGVANVNLPLFHYRQHGRSLTGNEDEILSTRSRILEKAAAGRKTVASSVAMVPIRGPALDLRSVALRPLGGRAVLEWTIDAALEARRISRVLVTSSDDAVERHVRAVYGDRVAFYTRDWHTALPDKPLDETLTTLFHGLPDEWRTFDAVTLLFVESPFRGPATSMRRSTPWRSSAAIAFSGFATSANLCSATGATEWFRCGVPACCARNPANCTVPLATSSSSAGAASSATQNATGTSVISRSTSVPPTAYNRSGVGRSLRPGPTTLHPGRAHEFAVPVRRQCRLFHRGSWGQSRGRLRGRHAPVRPRPRLGR